MTSDLPDLSSSVVGSNIPTYVPPLQPQWQQSWPPQQAVSFPTPPTHVSQRDMHLAGMLSQRAHQQHPQAGSIPHSYQPVAPSELMRRLSLSGPPVPSPQDMQLGHGSYSLPAGMRQHSRPQSAFIHDTSMGIGVQTIPYSPISPQSRRVQSRSIGSLYDIPPSFTANNAAIPSLSSVPFNTTPLASPNRPQPMNPRRQRQQEQLSANKERTIYISEVDHNVTEATIAGLFSGCGDVVDCRLCGDAHSRMRFAFVEFSQDTWRFAIPEALKLSGTVLGGYPIRVQKSRTAIIPVKKELLPKTEGEMEKCQRTIYASNIDKRFTQQDIITFFEALAVDQSKGADGKVAKIKMFGDSTHNTAIAFLEFYTPESATCALNNCQGALMGCLPLRVSPSKTPIRTAEEERAMRDADRNSPHN